MGGPSRCGEEVRPVQVGKALHSRLKAAIQAVAQTADVVGPVRDDDRLRHAAQKIRQGLRKAIPPNWLLSECGRTCWTTNGCGLAGISTISYQAVMIVPPW